MDPLKDIGLPLFIAAFYFISVFFAVLAIAPVLALTAAYVAVIVALVVYLVLDKTGSTEAGLPIGILLFFPVICIAAGIAWWIVRLLGLWQVN